MIYKGVEYTVTAVAPGTWRWQFRIGERVVSGKTEAKLNLLAIGLIIATAVGVAAFLVNQQLRDERSRLQTQGVAVAAMLAEVADVDVLELAAEGLDGAGQEDVGQGPGRGLAADAAVE